jgi:uncharacterized protein (DUF983 family)
MVQSLQSYPGTIVQCPICLDNEARPLAIHKGMQGYLHPIHHDCFEAWLKYHPSCPVCRMDFGRKVSLSIDDKEVEATIMIILGLAAGIFTIFALQHHYPQRVRFIDAGPIAFYTSVTSCLFLQHRNHLHPVSVFMLSLTLAIYFDSEIS